MSKIEINTKKTKASTESLADAPQKKKVRAMLTLVDKDDAVFKMTKEELKVSLANWFDACDPSLRKTCFGWGFSPKVAKEMHERRSVRKALEMYDTYYKDKPASLLADDKALCEGICPLHVFHIAAYEWSDDPDITYGSYEQQVLFFVMKHNLQKQTAVSIEKFVHRLLDLSYQLYVGEQYKEAGEDESGKIIWKKKTKIPHITKIEPHQQAAIGIFFFPNLQFLYKPKKEDTHYTLVCHEFKLGLASFCESLQQLDPRISPPHWRHECTGRNALDHAIAMFHKLLAYPESMELKFNEKPLTVVERMAFCAKF